MGFPQDGRHFLSPLKKYLFWSENLENGLTVAAQKVRKLGFRPRREVPVLECLLDELVVTEDNDALPAHAQAEYLAEDLAIVGEEQVELLLDVGHDAYDGKAPRARGHRAYSSYVQDQEVGQEGDGGRDQERAQVSDAADQMR